MALIVSPVELASACAAVFVVSRLLPDNMVFKPSIVLLLPALGFSVVVVILSTSLLLRRVSKIMSTQVLRDTRTLKKLRKVKSRGRFKLAMLVATSQASLYPVRLVSWSVPPRWWR